VVAYSAKDGVGIGGAASVVVGVSMAEVVVGASLLPVHPQNNARMHRRMHTVTTLCMRGVMELS